MNEALPVQNQERESQEGFHELLALLVQNEQGAEKALDIEGNIEQEEGVQTNEVRQILGEDEEIEAQRSKILLDKNEEKQFIETEESTRQKIEENHISEKKNTLINNTTIDSEKLLLLQPKEIALDVRGMKKDAEVQTKDVHQENHDISLVQSENKFSKNFIQALPEHKLTLYNTHSDNNNEVIENVRNAEIKPIVHDISAQSKSSGNIIQNTTQGELFSTLQINDVQSAMISIQEANLNSEVVVGNVKVKFSNAFDDLRNQEVRNSITKQISFKVLGALKENQGKINVQIEPEHLGKVEIVMEKQGNSTKVNILAEKFMTLDLLQRTSAQLEDAILKSGVSHDDTELSFGLKSDLYKHGKQSNSEGGEFADNSYDSDEFSDEDLEGKVFNINFELPEVLDIRV